MLASPMLVFRFQGNVLGVHNTDKINRVLNIRDSRKKELSHRIELALRA